MRHKLFHTIVLSGVNLVEGCALSHRTDDPAPPTDAGALPDSSLPDGGPSLDVFTFDATRPDAGNAPDATPDVFPVDAPMDARFCEPGWPPTKGIRVCQVVDEDGVAVLRCTYAIGEDMLPDFSLSNPCDAAVLGNDDAWIPPGSETRDVGWVGCSRDADTQCRFERSGGEDLIVCADASCILTDVLRDGTSAAPERK